MRRAWRSTDGAGSLGPAAASPPPAYYPGFDWLRVALAFAVFVHHVQWAPRWPGLGVYSANVFFALSGFLVGGAMLRTPWSGLDRFYFYRALRIGVPYAVSLALVAAAGLVHGDERGTWWWRFFAISGTFTWDRFGMTRVDAIMSQLPLGGAGVGVWSICVEERFYLLLPWVVALACLPRAMGAAGPRSPARAALLAALALGAFHWSAPDHSLYIFSGLALALLAERWPGWHLRALPRAAAAALVAYGAAAYLAGRGGFAGLGPLAAVSLVLLHARPGAARPWGRFLGGLTYPFYLNHWIGLSFAHATWRHLGASELAAGGVGFVVAAAVAVFHYVGIDLRLQARRSRWFRPGRGWACFAALSALVAFGFAYGRLGGWPGP